MKLDMKTRICRLGLKQTVLTEMLKEAGIPCYKTEVCAVINKSGALTPKKGKIRNGILLILADEERKRGWDKE